MDVHYHGCVLCFLLVEEGRYLSPVEAGVTHDPRPTKAARWDAGRRRAGKAARVAVGQLDDPDVGVALGRGKGEGEPPRVQRELQAAHDACGYLRVGHPASTAVEEHHVGVAVHVAGRDEVAA